MKTLENEDSRICNHFSLSRPSARPPARAADEGCGVDETVVEAGARGGSVEVLDWCKRFVKQEEFEWHDRRICFQAAKSGNIQALK